MARFRFWRLVQVLCLALALVFTVTLMPLASRAQVMIEERVHIKSEQSTQTDSSGGGGAVFIRSVGAVSASKSSATSIPGSCEPQSFDDADYIPCAGILFQVGFYCECGALCPASGYAIVQINNAVTTEPTFTWWPDSTTDIVVTSASETIQPDLNNGDPVLLSEFLTVISQKWWGVHTYTWQINDLSGDPICWGNPSPELPKDSDDDLIADAWEMKAENGASLDLTSAIGPSHDSISCPDDGDQDACWDGETSTGSLHDGDGFTKMEEYQGVVVGSDHHRLLAGKKEILLDISEFVQEGGDVQAAAEWAAGKLLSDLDIEPHVAFGIDGLKDNVAWPGNNEVERLGDGQMNPTRGYVRLGAAGTWWPAPFGNNLHERQNALFGNNSHYHWDDKPVEDDFTCAFSSVTRTNMCQPLLSFYDTRPDLDLYRLGKTDAELRPDGYWFSLVFHETISNLYDANLITESVTNNLFWWPIADTKELVTYNAYFNNADVDGQSGKNAANPLEVLFDPRPLKAKGINRRSLAHNNATPDLIGGLSRLDLLKRVTLHELGHAVGMWVKVSGGVCTALRDVSGPVAAASKDCHPAKDDSVMRPGVGPAVIESFSVDDKKTVNLHR